MQWGGKWEPYLYLRDSWWTMYITQGGSSCCSPLNMVEQWPLLNAVNIWSLQSETKTKLSFTCTGEGEFYKTQVVINVVNILMRKYFTVLRNNCFIDHWNTKSSIFPWSVSYILSFGSHVITQHCDTRTYIEVSNKTGTQQGINLANRVLLAKVYWCVAAL